eukprot:COSAG01_NODE_3940_length_5513_cov_18.497968_5_plen_41_part_00
MAMMHEHTRGGKDGGVGGGKAKREAPIARRHDGTLHEGET